MTQAFRMLTSDVVVSDAAWDVPMLCRQLKWTYMHIGRTYAWQRANVELSAAPPLTFSSRRVER